MMRTTASIKVEVNLLEKSVTYMANMLLQLAYRIEGLRIPGSRHMADWHEVIERGFRTWLAEQKLLTVHYELFPPGGQEAYEKCLVELSYSTDPCEAVVKPPIEELEALLKRLGKLPPGTRYLVVVERAPGASHVDGWFPTTLKPLMRGLKEDVEIGRSEFGFGHISGKTRYMISNWDGPAGDPPGKTE